MARNNPADELPESPNEPQQSPPPLPEKSATQKAQELGSKALSSPDKLRNPKEALFDAGKSVAGAAAAKVVPGGEEAVEKVNQARKIAMRTQMAIEGAKNAALAAKGAATAAAPILANPIFWIVVLVILVLIITLVRVVAGAQVIGRNENAKGCVPDSTGSGVEAVWSEDQTATANSIAGWLTSTSFNFNGGKPLSVNQAAAFIGNWVQESNLNPAAGQNGAAGASSSNDDIRAVSGWHKAVGLVQWDGGRRGALADYADSKGKIWHDLNLQLSFVQSELDGGAYGGTLASNGFNDAAKSIDELVDLVNRHYEVSGDAYYEGNPVLTERRNNRVNAAKAFLANYNGGYSSTTGGGCLTERATVGGLVHPLGPGSTFPITSPFGMRIHPITGVPKLHEGTDWGAPCGAPFSAMVSGTIKSVGNAGGWGNLTVLASTDGSMEVYYAHQPWGASIPPVGTPVNAGDIIGEVGTTGSSTACHAHIEVHKSGEVVDPENVLREAGITP
jgi:murein DD-endopeptidase MepM/ murein hydrolase activator NlpD